MSRSGFVDGDSEYPELDQGRYSAWRNAAFNGPRGRAFLAELKLTLEVMPEKRLIADNLIKDGAVCAIGAVGKARGLDMGGVDPDDTERVAKLFNLPKTLVREVVFTNDDDFNQYGTWEVHGQKQPYGCGTFVSETPEHRWERVHTWVTNELNRIVARG